jgi:hypothetical protein
VFSVRVAGKGLMLEMRAKKSSERVRDWVEVGDAGIPTLRVFWKKSLEDDENTGNSDLSNAKEFVRISKQKR